VPPCWTVTRRRTHVAADEPYGLNAPTSGDTVLRSSTAWPMSVQDHPSGGDEHLDTSDDTTKQGQDPTR
jgi:hypothetical protein